MQSFSSGSNDTDELKVGRWRLGLSWALNLLTRAIKKQLGIRVVCQLIIFKLSSARSGNSFSRSTASQFTTTKINSWCFTRLTFSHDFTDGTKCFSPLSHKFPNHNWKILPRQHRHQLHRHTHERQSNKNVSIYHNWVFFLEEFLVHRLHCALIFFTNFLIYLLNDAVTDARGSSSKQYRVKGAISKIYSPTIQLVNVEKA